MENSHKPKPIWFKRETITIIQWLDCVHESKNSFVLDNLNIENIIFTRLSYGYIFPLICAYSGHTQTHTPLAIYLF